MRQSRFLELLSAHLDGEASPEEQALLENALRGNAVYQELARRHIRLHRASRQAVRQAGWGEKAPDFAPAAIPFPGWTRWMGAATVAAAVLLVAGTAWWQVRTDRVHGPSGGGSLALAEDGPPPIRWTTGSGPESWSGSAARENWADSAWVVVPVGQATFTARPVAAPMRSMVLGIPGELDLQQAPPFPSLPVQHHGTSAWEPPPWQPAHSFAAPAFSVQRAGWGSRP